MSRSVSKLDFIKPLGAHNTATFTLEPEGPATRVTWAIEGRNALINKVTNVFFSMDRMVGGMFEAGLADMKTAAEGPT